MDAGMVRIVCSVMAAALLGLIILRRRNTEEQKTVVDRFSHDLRAEKPEIMFSL